MDGVTIVTSHTSDNGTFILQPIGFYFLTTKAIYWKNETANACHTRICSIIFLVLLITLTLALYKPFSYPKPLYHNSFHVFQQPLFAPS
jgi:hypothetical protein